jgi:RNA polymerase sigma-70 factor (ECF subfamily)
VEPVSTIAPRRGQGAGPPPNAETRTFEDLYREELPFVWRNARRLLGLDSAVDDVVQEVFIVALRRIGEFEGRSSLRSWLYGILRRVAADHRRAVRRRNIRDSADLEAIATRESGPHRTAEKAESLVVLHELLGKLDEDKREVFILVELENMTAPEITTILGISLTTVHARLRDARRQFELATRRYQARQNGVAP